MKIALIRRRFSPVGGGELYLQRLMEGLVKKGHSVHLLSELWNVTASNIHFHAVTGARSRGRRSLCFAEEVDKVLQSLKVDCVFSLERTLRQDVYRAGDGVHAVWLERQKAFAPFWKRPFCGLSKHHRNLLALEAKTFHPNHTKFVIANSNMVKDEILERFGFPENRIRVIPNGADLQRFEGIDREAARQAFGFSRDEFVLLFAGSGWDRKGLAFSVQLLSDLRKRRAWFPASFRSVKLLVAGKGRPPICRDPDVLYAGALERIQDAYGAANLMAFLPIYEPAANVVTEALASRLPVLTTSLNGASEWIIPGINGHVIPTPRDRMAAVDAALFWMHQNRMSPEPSSELSMQRNVEQTLDLLQEACR